MPVKAAIIIRERGQKFGVMKMSKYVNDMPWVKFTTNSYLHGKYVC
jgi:hypothetical protein